MSFASFSRVMFVMIVILDEVMIKLAEADNNRSKVRGIIILIKIKNVLKCYLVTRLPGIL